MAGRTLAGGARGSLDGIVVSFAECGSYEWHECLGGAANDDPHDLAVDRVGTTYVTGSTDGGAFVDGGELPAHGEDDGIAAAFAADGTLLGVRSFGGPGIDHSSGIAYDPATGAVIVVGVDSEPALFGNEPLGAGVVVYRFVP